MQKNIVDSDLPLHEDILENTVHPDMPALEDIFENTIDPYMTPLEDIFNDYILDNANIVSHNCKPSEKGYPTLGRSLLSRKDLLCNV